MNVNSKVLSELKTRLVAILSQIRSDRRSLTNVFVYEYYTIILNSNRLSNRNSNWARYRKIRNRVNNMKKHTITTLLLQYKCRN